MHSMIKEEKVDISIVIPAKNEAENIGNCLDAVFAQDTDLAFDVMVIDSGSSDGTLDILGKYPRVRLEKIAPEEFGHGKTRNLGARMSRGEYIVFLNADALPADSNWLQSLVAGFSRHEQAAGVFSRHLPKEGCHLYMARDILKSMPGEPQIRERVGDLDFMVFSTVSAAIKRSAWQKYPFQEEILIAEDQEWASRVTGAGFTIVYEPGSRVFHSHNYSMRELFDVKRKVGKAIKKFKNPLAARLLGFPFVLGGAVFKILGDIFFIFFASPGKTGLIQKFKETGRSISARIAGFAGRYAGWIAS